MYSNNTNTNNHAYCKKTGTWCGKFAWNQYTVPCINQPRMTEGDCRMCSRCFGSPDCIQQNSCCGEDCVNYSSLMMNPHPINCFIGEACRPWQPNDGRGGREIPGLNRNDYTEEQQKQIIDHLNSLEDTQGPLSQETMLEAVLQFMPNN